MAGPQQEVQVKTRSRVFDRPRMNAIGSPDRLLDTRLSNEEGWPSQRVGIVVTGSADEGGVVHDREDADGGASENGPGPKDWKEQHPSNYSVAFRVGPSGQRLIKRRTSARLPGDAFEGVLSRCRCCFSVGDFSRVPIVAGNRSFADAKQLEQVILSCALRV